MDKNVTPVVINFSCLDDQALVWNALNGGCKTNCIKVTKDSRTLKEKENFFKTFISQRKVNKPEKKSNYHANCGGPDGHHDHDHDHGNENEADMKAMFHNTCPLSVKIFNSSLTERVDQI